METRANFALIGVLTLAAILGAFYFVFWFSGAGKIAQFKTYRLVVRGSVEGLTIGNDVKFNGLKVGQVTNLEIDPEDPSLVDAEIRVAQNTPVKTDTRARIEQGSFTGVAKVALIGGTPDAPNLVKKAGEDYPRIAVEPSEIQNLLENVQRLAVKASSVADRLDKFFDTNSASLNSSVKNVEAFTKSLADNSQPAGNLIRDAADFMHSAKPLAERLDRLIAGADRAVKALDPKTLKAIAGNVAGASSNLNRFSAGGLRQYEQLAIDARKAVDSLDRAVRNFERDPSQVIFGPSEKVPEVQGH